MDTRSARLVPLLVAALVMMGLAPAASGAKPQPGKSYSATASPTFIAFPVTAPLPTVTVTLRNCGCTGVQDSGQPFASAQLRVLASDGLDLANASVTRTGWSPQPWTDANGDSVLTLVSSGTGTTNAVPAKDSLAVTIPVKANPSQGAVTIRTAVKQSNDFSGTGNDFADVGSDPVVYLGAGPADHLVWLQQPSTVQVSSSAAVAGTGVTPVTSMCPAPSVKVVDAQDNIVTAARTVTLSPVGSTLAIGGTTSVTTVNGIATFGTCASGVTSSTLGREFTVNAATTGLPSLGSATFSVLATYGTCASNCSLTGATGPNKTTAGLQANAGSGASGSDRLSFGVGIDPWSTSDLAACDPDPESTGRTNPYRDPVTVDLANHDKTVTLRWTKQAVQWATNNGSSQWHVCLAAAASFSGSTAVGSWFIGYVQPCGVAPAGDPCLSDLRRNGGDQLATVNLPNQPGDPRMI